MVLNSARNGPPGGAIVENTNCKKSFNSGRDGPTSSSSGGANVRNSSCNKTAPISVRPSLARPTFVRPSFARPGFVAILVASIAVCAAAASLTVVAAVELDEPSMAVDKPGSVAAILVALQNGPAGEEAVREWSTHLDHAIDSGRPSDSIPSVWILSSDSETAALADELPHVERFSFAPEQSWAETLEDFVFQNEAADTFGLLGEGVLPHPDLCAAVWSLHSSLARRSSDASPAVVLARSRSKRYPDDAGSDATENGDAYNNGASSGGGGRGGEEWISDAFSSQIWVNAEMLVSDRLGEAGLGVRAVQDLSLLHALPRIIEASHRSGASLVDGTSVIGSLFSLGEDSGGGQQLEELPSSSTDGTILRFGTLELALVRNGGGRGEDGNGEGTEGERVKIGKAPWPPAYILETVANKDGLVMVNSVNCGYLDFASNFLQSVRKFVSDAKVLWVTTDEVAFDFMDAMVPGCVAMFPGDNSDRHHSIAAGTYGDAVFRSQVLVRPRLLRSILAAGYTALWTDSDMVWLGNPLLLLPNVYDPHSSDVMLQNDGFADSKCTCFMYLRPTNIVKELLMLWEKSIIDSRANEDQKPFRAAFVQQQDAGLRYAIVPPLMFPTGKQFFDHDYVENYAQVYHSEALIAHNNWIKGHDVKLERFREYHLWGVDETSFPICSERR